MDRYTIELRKDDDSKIIINRQSKEINMTVSEQIVLANVKTQAKSVTPTESAQTITPDQDYDALSSVDVAAIDSSYVGSAIQRRSGSNLTVSGASVTAPAGYYSSAATKSVATATQATPQVSINTTTGLVTATATQSTGYVNGGTTSDELQLSIQAAKTVTPSSSQQTAVQAGKYTTGNVTVNPIPSEYIVPSGTLSITSNGTKDVTNYASANVNIQFNTQTKSVNPTESQQTVTPDSGYSGLSSVTVGAVSSTYVGSGITRKTAQTYTPSTSTQTISSGQYLSGTQTINPIPSQYIVPSGNIAITENGTGIDVSQYATATVNVSSGGSSKNIQAYRGYDTVSATSYTATDVTITVSKTGTYNVSWMGYRNTTSGTSGSQLYKNGSAVGSASTSFVNSYGQSVSLTNQSFNQGDVLVVRARARSTSYIMGVGNLIIEEV